MNAEERKNLKRANDSKDIWKQRAIERQKTLRLQQLRIRDLETSRNNWKGKYFEAKEHSLIDVQGDKDISPKQTPRELKKIEKKIDLFSCQIGSRQLCFLPCCSENFVSNTI